MPGFDERCWRALRYLLIFLPFSGLPAQIQRIRKIRVKRFRRPFGSFLFGHVSVIPETAHAACFCLVGVDRQRIVIASTGMADMVGTAADRTPAPGVNDVEYQRGLHSCGGVQC